MSKIPTSFPLPNGGKVKVVHGDGDTWNSLDLVLRNPDGSEEPLCAADYSNGKLHVLAFDERSDEPEFDRVIIIPESTEQNHGTHAIITHKLGQLDTVELFDTYQKAQRYFERLLNEEQEAHADDGGWITSFTMQYADDSMCFFTKQNKQVYYAALEIK